MAEEPEGGQRRCQSQPTYGRQLNGCPTTSQRARLFTMGPVQAGPRRAGVRGGSRGSMCGHDGGEHSDSDEYEEESLTGGGAGLAYRNLTQMHRELGPP